MWKKAITSSIHIYFILAYIQDGVSSNSTKQRSRSKLQGQRCQFPQNITNGQWKVYVESGTATAYKLGQLVPNGIVLRLSCKNGFKVNRDAFIHCSNGKFNSKFPECLRACPSVDSTTIMFVTCSFEGTENNCKDAVSRTTAKFSCAPYYELSTTNNIRYCMNGTWDEALPNCQPVCGQIVKSLSKTSTVGDSKVEYGPYPWTILLYEGRYVVFKLKCAGTLISPGVIITAAHCVCDENGKKFDKGYYRVAAGKRHKDYFDKRDVHAEVAEVAEIFVAPYYAGSDWGLYYGDIAMIVTKVDFNFTQYIQPVCVDWNSAFNEEDLDGSYGTISSYKTDFQDLHTYLEESITPYVKKSECALSVPDFANPLKQTRDKFCVGNFKDTTICAGDFGGGVAFFNSERKRHFLRGILTIPDSTIKACGPREYYLCIRISEHIDFIREIYEDDRLKRLASYQTEPKSENEMKGTTDNPNGDNGYPVSTNERTTQSTILYLTEPSTARNCTLPSQIPHGVGSIYDWSPTNYLPGSKMVPEGTALRIKCNDGFKIDVTKFPPICVNGSWYPEIPRCVSTTKNRDGGNGNPVVTNASSTPLNIYPTEPSTAGNCTLPSQILHGGRFIFEGYSAKYLPEAQMVPEGTALRIKCNNGYKRDGINFPSFCLNGSWYPKIPRCVRTTDNPNGDNGYPVSTNESPQSNIYTTEPSTAGSCSIPSQIQDGVWSIYDKNYLPGAQMVPEFTVLRIKCNKGFNIVGLSYSPTCANGRWYPEVPRCAKACPTLPGSDKLSITCFHNKQKIHCNDSVINTTASFKCPPFYEVSTLNSVRFCSKEGDWDEAMPYCKPICGQTIVSAKPLIIGGKEALRGTYPWTIGLYVKKGESFDHRCGGSLISRNVIFTAAHCVSNGKDDKYNENIYRVAAGKYYRSYHDERDSEAEFSEVKHIFVPEWYKGGTLDYEYDIAVLITTKVFNLTRYIQPVCVDWDRSSNYESELLGDSGTVTGWGFTVRDGNASETLKEISLPFVAHKVCSKGTPDDYQRYIREDKICAGYLDKGIGVCEGDSGGGLTFWNPVKNRYYLRAIVSIAPRTNGYCDENKYAFYTKVSKYIDFLVSKEREYRVE